MADDSKQSSSSNGGSLISEMKHVFALLRTKRTGAIAYVFMFAFIAFTLFLAFNPSSNSSSPWFSNIFSNSVTSTNSGTGSSIFSDDSYRSHFSSIFSYFLPNSSQQQYSDFAPPPLSIDKNTRSQNTTGMINQTLGEKGEAILKANETSQQPPPANNQTLAKDKFEVPKSNKTTIQPTNPKQNVASVPKASPANPKQNVASVPQASPPANPKQNVSSVPKASPANPKQNVASVPQVSPTANPKQNVASVPQISPPASSNKTEKEENKVVENGKVNNLTSSLAKKQSNGSNSGLPEVNLVESMFGCDLFDGEWVRDESYPLYKPGSCSLIDEQFNCHLNGRPDNGYQKLKWKPRGCSIPRLNATHMLELLRGKRLVFVGDSLNRNMWESLVCILRNSVKNQKNVYEASGRHHFRSEVSYSFVFKDYDCTVEFFVAPFLVQEWEVSEKDGSKKETLRLDIIGRSADLYKNADIIVFNTGHWWTHDKTSKGKDYYQEGSHVYSELNVLEAFRKALTTWGRWVDANVNPTKTHVFFRGYSASHFSGGQWNSGGQCNNETQPIKERSYLKEYPPKMRTLERVIKGMKFPVSYLNITTLTDYRKDGHPSVYRKQRFSDEEKKSPLLFQDCSHWCLPGVPDAWNEILYAELLIKQHQSNRLPKRPS
ncbi:protein trichome birefringence-like [Impatiens glandulifera]|uniref:protein trichome birefringence-like n=1 Tax=Impatiens glandulifera TaxID=253017 RepID=UPI001FB08565|nr:protein trichome birefringence-like [Impatiens glandulifera]